MFRAFLRENGSGLTTRSSMAALAKVYTRSVAGDLMEKLRAIVETFPLQDQALELKRTALRAAANAVDRLEIAVCLRLLSQRPLAWVPRGAGQMPRFAALSEPETAARAVQALASFAIAGNTETFSTSAPTTLQPRSNEKYIELEA